MSGDDTRTISYHNYDRSSCQHRCPSIEFIPHTSTEMLRSNTDTEIRLFLVNSLMKPYTYWASSAGSAFQQCIHQLSLILSKRLRKHLELVETDHSHLINHHLKCVVFLTRGGSKPNLQYASYFLSTFPTLWILNFTLFP